MNKIFENSDTIFHKIINKTSPAYIIYEDDLVLAILDIFPVVTGHVLVLPKIFSRNLKDIDEKTMLTLFSKSRKLALQIIDKLQVEGFRLTVHSEKSAGQEIFYTHLHIVPTDSDFENRKNFDLLVKKLQIKHL